LSSEPFFSVVIAAFNAAHWIVPTVRSALAQTYRGYEIIVVGDGCTDATGEILESEFGASIRWTNLDRNHGGQSFPNNEGIRHANGTHIAYLGHDDIWSPRHLAALASIVQAHDPDFAVSGAVYQGPPGSGYYQVAGLFDDPRAAETDFFPPSSFAHRRAVVERIGLWREPRELQAPADCDFLLRAVGARCTFASTGTITVHKFAAGHRYLSYRFPSAGEQERMLERLATPGGEVEALAEIDGAIAAGADHPRPVHCDLAGLQPGDLFFRNRRVKGLDREPPTAVDRRCRFGVESFAAGLDWHALEIDAIGRRFRWSGPNPNARHLVNVRSNAPLVLRIHVLGFANATLGDALAIDVDDRAVAFARERSADGTYVFATQRLAGPVHDGLVLCFRLPAPLPRFRPPDSRRAGLALSSVEVVPVP